MRRVIFGAAALVAAALAAVGIAGRRRRVRGDEWLPVEAAPPIAAPGAGDGVPALACDTVAAEPSGAREASASVESAASAEPSGELSVEPSVESAASAEPSGPADPAVSAESAASAEPSVELSVEPSAQPSVEADYGPVNVPAGAPSDASATPRTRSRRKTIAVPPEPAEPVPGDTAPAP